MDSPLDLSAAQPRSSVIRSPAGKPFAQASPRAPSQPAVLPQCPPPSLLGLQGILGAFPGQASPDSPSATPSETPSATPSPQKSPAKGQGPNRMSYPREFKLMVIDYFHHHGSNKYRTCKEFQITKSMLNGWLSKREKIEQSRPGSLKSGRSGRRPQFPDVERKLFTIYTDAVAAGTKVGNRWIRDRARSLARSECSEAQLGGMCQFSERWLSNFKKRFAINLHKDWSCSSSEDSAPSSSAAHSETSAEPAPTESADASDLSADEAPAPLHRPTPVLPTIALPPEAWPGLSALPGAYAHGRRGRKVQFPEVEALLYRRVLERAAAGGRLSNRWVQEEARDIARRLCPSLLDQTLRSARCSFSEHWLHNFKRRFGLTLKGHRLVSHSPAQAQALARPEAAESSADSQGSPAPRSPASTPPPPAQPPTELPDAAVLMQRWQQLLLQQSLIRSLLPQVAPLPPAHVPCPAAAPPTAPVPALDLSEWYNKMGPA